MIKTAQLQLRVSPAEKARIREAAARAGVDMSEWVLSHLFPAEGETFLRLVGELREVAKGQSTGTSHAIAALNDFLADLPADRFVEAVSAHPDGLSPFHANYVAAMVEHAAYLKGAPPPAWVAEVAPLERPVFGSELASLRLHLLTKSPPAFRRRNIFIDATVGDRV